MVHRSSQSDSDSRVGSGTRAQRAIFGRPEREDIHLFLGKVETKAEKAREDFEKRWNFSLVEDKPIEGRIQWETLKARKNQGSPTSTSNSAGAGQTRTAERSSKRSSSKATINRHFKLKKLRKDSVRVSRSLRHRTSSSSNKGKDDHMRRNCSSYSLRPLPQRNYSQITFTI